MFTANAAADIFYLYSKVRNMQAATAALSFLFKIHEVVSVTHEDCVAALQLPVVDFEDALDAVCGQKANVDYIITRDEQFLANTLPIKKILPSNFVLTHP